VRREVIAQSMTDQSSKRENTTIEEATYDTIKEQIVAKQKR